MSRNRELLEVGAINARYPELDPSTVAHVRRLVELRVAVRHASLNDLFLNSSDSDYIQAFNSMLTAAMEFWVSFNESLGQFTDIVAETAAGQRTKKRDFNN